MHTKTEGKGQYDSGEWRNWHMDDFEPDSYDEWDADEGLLTPSNHYSR